MDSVREAKDGADISHVVRCVIDLRKAINGPIEVDTAWTGSHVARLIQSPAAVVYVTSGGFIAGELSQTVINPSVIAIEQGWYASDKTGIMLLSAFEKWASDMGAMGIKMSTSQDENTMAGRILKKRGYKPAELMWFK